MVCPRCGNECGDARFCSSCGATLIRSCRKCGHPLRADDRFCPECGADSRKDQRGGSACALIGFLMTVILAGFNLFVGLFMTNVSFNVWMNGHHQLIPMNALVACFVLLHVLLILFAVLFRLRGSKGFGIAAIVMAVVLKIMTPFTIGSLIMLAGTIMSYVCREDRTA